MIFKDKIEIIEAGWVEDPPYGGYYDWAEPEVVQVVGARVDYRSTAMLDSVDMTFMSKAELIAYCEPTSIDSATQRVLWNGLQYEPDGQVLEYRRGRRTFYVEIPLKTVQPQP